MQTAREHLVARRLAHRHLLRAALDLELGLAAFACARHDRLALRTRTRMTQEYAFVLAYQSLINA